MLSSGIVERTSTMAELEEEEMEENSRVHLLVQNILPPFLDGHLVFTKQFEPVLPLKVLPVLPFFLNYNPFNKTMYQIVCDFICYLILHCYI